MNDLMTHRAGFEEGLKDLLATDPARLKTTEAYLKENQRPQLFPAGAVPAYSNYGAALAGYIVERVSGEPFAAYVEHHILTPLQMPPDDFRPAPAPRPRRVDVQGVSPEQHGTRALRTGRNGAGRQRQHDWRRYGEFHDRASAGRALR